jgi:hypothetical protein
VDPSADVGVLALGVLPDADDVDVLRLPVAERSDDSREEPHRAQVHVLVERLADRQDQAPAGDVVGDLGRADRPEVDGVVLVELLERASKQSSAEPAAAAAKSKPRPKEEDKQWGTTVDPFAE